MRIKEARDQPPWIRSLDGKICLVLRNLTERDGVTSSKNIWLVLIDGVAYSVHSLDLSPIHEDDSSTSIETQ